MAVDTKNWKLWAAIGVAAVGVGAVGWQIVSASRSQPVRAASAGQGGGPGMPDVLTNGHGPGGPGGNAAFGPSGEQLDAMAKQMGMTPQELRAKMKGGDGAITFEGSVDDAAKRLGMTPEEVKAAAGGGKPVVMGMDDKSRATLQGLGISPEEIMKDVAAEQTPPAWQEIKTDEDAQRVGALLEENAAREAQPLLKDDPSPTSNAAKLGAAAKTAILGRLRGGGGWTKAVSDLGGTPPVTRAREKDAVIPISGSSLDPNLVRTKAAMKGPTPMLGGGGPEGDKPGKAVVMTVMRRSMNGKDDSATSDMRMGLGEEFPKTKDAKGRRVEVICPIQPPKLEARPGSVKLGVVLAEVTPGVWQPAELVLHISDPAVAKQIMKGMRDEAKKEQPKDGAK